MKRRKKPRRIFARLVAWGSWKEWDCVRAALFSGTPSRISAAIDRITAWQARTRVPVAVEITANILSIHQRDPSVRDNIPEALVLSDEMLRLMYSMSIVRLINGVVDDKRRFGHGSVADRALEANLPHLLVTIRHDSAHGELPGVALLRMASKQALEWLRVFYWQRQKETLRAARSKLKDLLLEYITVLKETYIPPDGPVSQDKKRIKRVRCDREVAVGRLIKESRMVPQEIVSILIDDMLLYKTHEKDDDDTHRPKGDDDTNGSDSEKLSSLEDLACKYAITRLSFAMPELLQMLALGAVRRLTGLPAVADGTGYSFAHEDCAKVTNISSNVEANRLTDWLEWFLDASKAEKTCRKSGRELQLDNGGVKGEISQELCKELLSICLKGAIENKVKLRLVKLLTAATDVDFDKTSRLAEKLCEFHSPATKTNKSGQEHEREVVQSPPAELSNLESSLTEMKRTQQEKLLFSSGDEGKLARNPGGDQESGLQSGSQRRRWTEVANWQPCAIGMLPSSCYFGGVRPAWLLDCSKELCGKSSWDEEENATVAATKLPDQSWKKRKACDDEDERSRAAFTVPARDKENADESVGGDRDKLVQQGINFEDARPSQALDVVEDREDREDAREETMVESIKGCLRVNGDFQSVGRELLAAIQAEIRVL